VQHACGHRIGLAVIVDVDIQPVHDVEVRVGEELFHRRVAHLGTDARAHERLEIGVGRERPDILERGDRRTGNGLVWLGLGRCGKLGIRRYGLAIAAFWRRFWLRLPRQRFLLAP